MILQLTSYGHNSPIAINLNSVAWFSPSSANHTLINMVDGSSFIVNESYSQILKLIPENWGLK